MFMTFKYNTFCQKFNVMQKVNHPILQLPIYKIVPRILLIDQIFKLKIQIHIKYQNSTHITNIIKFMMV